MLDAMGLVTMMFEMGGVGNHLGAVKMRALERLVEDSGSVMGIGVVLQRILLLERLDPSLI